ncbi:hypothetical protein AUEXF2481DRAFT_26924 [Aureobasidium subglaciale EXF-2481]|uniref:BTB domain-containing protein n=1 Tax=Aureobasidium subglaciale (strain EXF-2481) TaxID=1043005 RepID=A0A074YWK9_AURSE|nr:uncharacterized protein AUEXF2481DRAFT_26924 [Aureobasidium subglaciale EXF-2481]KAI5198842.1 hypothetical protein E4T38_07326 [Aureobasidium subglaciale]KAI5217650.1 hypothetical protein E4T40_07337 [Aureobasidium subglaciale]KAI5221190.1 hypothetical protein E4T41_07178 [Aureobasidium subglaciale]KAI5258963.1 hypothetical protein E4T46_07155 [Aureobasidium subglaciale]KEQ98557.1 hypothetical protein AUEXF2481DRAFT_26924 [Aureobasidium subglaciale EXF-2481]
MAEATNPLFADPEIYNNRDDSDIIIKFGDQQIFAHRVVLRMWSPFFKRSLSSKFASSILRKRTLKYEWWSDFSIVNANECTQVATNSVFDLGGEDDPDHIKAMLMHMYGLRYSEHPLNPSKQAGEVKPLGDRIGLFMVAGKYDCPSVRVAVITLIQEQTKTKWNFSSSSKLNFKVASDAFLAGLGPDAPQLADGSLVEVIYEFLEKNFGGLMRFGKFSELVKSGALLNAQMSARLLFKLGKDLV